MEYRNMKTIGIDIGALAITDDRLKVGVYRVTHELIKEIALRDKKNTYRLYSFQKDIPLTLPKNIQQRALTPSFGYKSIRLPWELFQYPVDIFIGPQQMLPNATIAKKIVIIYDIAFLRYPEWYAGSVKKLSDMTEQAVKNADVIIVISKSTKQEIMKVYEVDAKKIVVSYPGIYQLFTPYGEKYSNSRPYILYVGSQKRGKNLPNAIRAFAQFQKKTKVAYDFIWVGGDYWPDMEIDALLHSTKVNTYIKKIGVVSDETLAALYRGATAYFSPSYWEGFGLGAAEAMASGCPVIVSDRGAYPEVVKDAGIYVDPDDINQMVEALMSVTTNMKKRSMMIRDGIRRSKRFTWKKFAKAILDQYK